MKKILIPILILPLMFFTGCEEEETLTGSTDSISYSIEDMVGTWDIISNIGEVSMSIDLSSLVTMFTDNLDGISEMECEEEGFTWSDSCTISDEMVVEMLGDFCSEGELENWVCDEGNGTDWYVSEDECDQECNEDCTFYEEEEEDSYTYTLIGTTCNMEVLEQECCEEGQSEVATITSDGTITLVGVDEGVEHTDIGTISVDGTTVMIVIDEECECSDLESQEECEAMAGCMFVEGEADGYQCSGDYDGDCSFSQTGVLSIDGDTATLTLDINAEDLLEEYVDDDEEEDEEEDVGYDFNWACDDEDGTDWYDSENECNQNCNEDCTYDEDDNDFDFPVPTVSGSQIIVLQRAAE